MKTENKIVSVIVVALLGWLGWRYYNNKKQIENSTGNGTTNNNTGTSTNVGGGDSTTGSNLIPHYSQNSNPIKNPPVINVGVGELADEPHYDLPTDDNPNDMPQDPPALGVLPTDNANEPFDPNDNNNYGHQQPTFIDDFYNNGINGVSMVDR